MALNCMHIRIQSEHTASVPVDQCRASAACEHYTRLVLLARDPPLRAVWHLDPRSRRLEMRWGPIKDEDDAHRATESILVECTARLSRHRADEGYHPSRAAFRGSTLVCASSVG
jgi:hypothetical protein